VIGATRSGQKANVYCDAEYFLFSTEEWDQMPADDGTRRANEILSAVYEDWDAAEEDHGIWYPRYRDLVIEVSLRTLNKMVADGIFVGEGPDQDLFLMLGISDSMIPFKEGVEWSRRLNNPSMHQRYCEWIRNVIEPGS
jgi:hypothetical protein